MKALAGPAMLLLVVGGWFVYTRSAQDDTPGQKYIDLELAAADADHTGTCYALSTVLVANGINGRIVRTWKRPDDDDHDKWRLRIETMEGAQVLIREYTFDKVEGQIRLVEVYATKGLPDDPAKVIDDLLQAPHAWNSTPVDRCRNGGAGYQYPPPK